MQNQSLHGHGCHAAKFGTNLLGIVFAGLLSVSLPVLAASPQGETEEQAIQTASHIKDWKAGVKYLENYSAKHPTGAETAGWEARLANQAGMNEKTILYSTKYFQIKKPPVDPYIYQLRANAYMNEHKPAKALADLNTASKTTTDPGGVCFAIACAYRQQNNLKKAIEYANRAVEKQYWRGYQALAEVSREQNDMAAAANYYALYAEKTSQVDAALHDASQWADLGDFANSMLFLNRFVGIQNKEVREKAMRLRAHVLFKQRRYSEALQQVNEYENLSNKELTSLRYFIAMQMRDYPTALVSLNKRFKESPKEKGLHLLRGDVNANLKNFDAAYADFKMVPELVNTADKSTKLNWTESLLKTGHLKEAEAELSRFNETEPTAKTFAMEGCCLARMKNYPDAIIRFNGALKMAPLNPSYFAARGETYRREQKSARAVVDFNDAITLDKKNSMYVLARGLAYLGANKPEAAVTDFTTVSADPALRNRALVERAKAYEMIGDKTKAAQDRQLVGDASKLPPLEDRLLN